ncbi:hypothetical protein SELMODRAFT_407775 [Selaginella moellendorffii]|uniref:Uncharacterized protein n=1 Tax=Selaginella moellendorffii TaxID=88036 RepID=D8R6Q1_SELML|nr:hypothetical protein SELMODRAFT_407775 [Selaginella moellendorffii]
MPPASPEHHGDGHPPASSPEHHGAGHPPPSHPPTKRHHGHRRAGDGDVTGPPPFSSAPNKADTVTWRPRMAGPPSPPPSSITWNPRPPSPPFDHNKAPWLGHLSAYCVVSTIFSSSSIRGITWCARGRHRYAPARAGSRRHWSLNTLEAEKEQGRRQLLIPEFTSSRGHQGDYDRLLFPLVLATSLRPETSSQWIHSFVLLIQCGNVMMEDPLVVFPAHEVDDKPRLFSATPEDDPLFSTGGYSHHPAGEKMAANELPVRLSSRRDGVPEQFHGREQGRKVADRSGTVFDPGDVAALAKKRAEMEKQMQKFIMMEPRIRPFSHRLVVSALELTIWTDEAESIRKRDVENSPQIMSDENLVWKLTANDPKRVKSDLEVEPSAPGHPPLTGENADQKSYGAQLVFLMQLKSNSMVVLVADPQNGYFGVVLVIEDVLPRMTPRLWEEPKGRTSATIPPTPTSQPVCS